MEMKEVGMEMGNVLLFETRAQRRERLLAELRWKLEVDEIRNAIERVEQMMIELEPFSEGGREVPEGGPRSLRRRLSWDK